MARTMLLHAMAKSQFFPSWKSRFRQLTEPSKVITAFHDLFERQKILQPVSEIKTEVHSERLQLSLNSFSFRTKAQLGEILFKSLGSAIRGLLNAQLDELTLQDGTIKYWRTPHKHRETILFLHGFADSSEGAYPLALRLAKHYNLIVPDLPGFGQSFKRQDLPHTYESYGTWLEKFVHGTCQGPVHVVGSSLGGAFALILAQNCPQYVASITLLNNASITDFCAASVYDEFMRGEIFFQVKNPDDFDQFLQRVFHKKPYSPPGFREYLFQKFQENHDWYGQLVSGIFEGVKDQDDPRYQQLFMNQKIQNLKVPSLVIWGDKDSLFPISFAETTHSLLSNSRLLILKDVGHAPHIEAPHLVAEHLKTFIEQQGLSSKSNIFESQLS